MSENNCWNCFYADKSRYFPSNDFEPETLPEIEGCVLCRDSALLTPSEGCTDWREEPDYEAENDDVEYERYADR